MTHCNSLNVKLSNSQLIKSKWAIKKKKKKIELTLTLLWNMIINSNDETDFQHSILLTDRQVSKLRKTSANYSLANIKLSKTLII